MGSHGKYVQGAAFTRDGRILATVDRGEKDTKVSVWEAATGKLLHQVDCPVMITSYEASFSPDGRHLAMICSDGSARIIGVGTWETVAILQGQEGLLTGTPVFSPDGKWLVTIGSRTAQAWL